MRGVSIIGVGTTRYGIFEDQTLKQLVTNACTDALKDGGVDRSQVEAYYLGNYISGMTLGQETLAPLTANSVGLEKDIPCTRVEGACSSASIALWHGYTLIASGVYDIVLVAGVEKMSGVPTERITASLGASLDMETEGRSGLTFPGFWALMARRHMYEFGTTIEQIGLVAVKNHKNASLNPRARFRNIITIEDVMGSRMITDPLKLYDCCPISDGASAAVLCASDRAKDFSGKAVDIIGCAQTTGFSSLYEQAQQVNLPATNLAAKKAFNMAGISPKDVDLVEIHDCFTPAEIVDSEDMGFFEKGKGGWAVQEGLTEVDGKIPINPSGGLLCKGHPTGATGLGQTYEVVRQLRGDHENQVKGAEIGVTHNAGGTGAVCAVTVLRRS